MYVLKIVRNIFELQENKNEIIEFLIAPIRFEKDPITGFYLKCPFCKKVSTFQFLFLESTIINCKEKNCKLLIDINEIRDKIK